MDATLGRSAQASTSVDAGMPPVAPSGCDNAACATNVLPNTARGPKTSTASTASAALSAPDNPVRNSLDGSNWAGDDNRRSSTANATRPTRRPRRSVMAEEKEEEMLRKIRDHAAAHPPAGIWKYKTQAAALYLDIKSQVFVALLIVTNFGISISEKQMDPTRELYTPVWDACELFFNIIFAMELALNMYGFWWKTFWSSGWNMFDFVVVSVGLVDASPIPLPGPLNLLRTLRAFRVFRLFKRVEELQKIIVSLVQAVPGVANAFLIMAIIMSIYAILAVEFFKDVGFADDGVTCEEGFETSRGNCFGWEYFGNFFKALYTLFQILTGESWSEAIVRLVLMKWGTWMTNVVTAIFFISYFIFTSIVLINIVVAVLLDKMSSLTTNDDDDDDFDEQPEEQPVGAGQQFMEEELSPAPAPLPPVDEVSGQEGLCCSPSPDGDDAGGSSVCESTDRPQLEQKARDGHKLGAASKNVENESGSGQCADASEVTALREEMACMRGHLETISAQLAMLVHLNGSNGKQEDWRKLALL